MDLIVKRLEIFEETMHMLTTKHVASRKLLLRQIFTFGNPPNLRAIASFHELVDITSACPELKNHCNDNIVSLPKSTASFERAMTYKKDRFNQACIGETLSYFNG
ncbi:hypothetical protein ACB094_09G163600 [Castanea mollissima]